MNRADRLLFVGSLGLAALGQWYFDARYSLLDGLVAYTLAIGLFVFLVRRIETTDNEPVDNSIATGKPLSHRVGRLIGLHPPMHPVRVWVQASQWLLAFGALALNAAALVLIRDELRPSYWDAFTLWAASIAAWMLAWAHDVPAPNGAPRPIAGAGASQVDLRAALRGIVKGIRRNGWEIVAVVLLLVLAFAVRVVDLAIIPQNLGGDEASQGLAALEVLEGRQPNMFTTGWLSVPTMSFFWQAAWFKFFGSQVFGLRLPWTIVGTVTVLVVYLLVRRLFGTVLALGTAFLLATYHYHIHYSRLGSNQVADALFISAALLFLLRGIDEGRRLDFVLAGIVAGLALYFYAGARLTPMLVAVVLTFVVVTRKGFWSHSKGHIAALVTAFLLVSSPMVLFGLRHPDDFNARLNWVGIFQSGWLAQEQANTGRSTVGILIDQFQRAFLAFNFYRDRVLWYWPPSPLLQSIPAIFFLLGLTYAAYRSCQRRYFVFVAWFLLTILLGGMLTDNPPSSQRLVGLTPVVSFLVALGVLKVVELGQRFVRFKPVVRETLLALLFTLIAALSVRFYFVDYTPLRIYGSVNSEVGTVLGYYLRNLGPDYEVYFFGPPRMWVSFASIPFLACGVPGVDVTKPLTSKPTFVDAQRKALFVFLPERLGELDVVQWYYPVGELYRFKRDGVPYDETLFMVYKVERPQ
jgi:4-amino-4-deoxy-L-arabinose transferase-like glycosyltransferase